MTMLSIIYCTAVFAQDSAKQDPIDKELKACLDSDTNYTTYGMIECEIRARDAWDSALNKYYKLLMQTLSGDERNKLKASQKNWLVFRDAENKFSSTMYGNMGGTMWGVAKVQVDANLINKELLN